MKKLIAVKILTLTFNLQVSIASDKEFETLQIDKSEAAGTTTANMPNPVDTTQGASGGVPKEEEVIFEQDDEFLGNPVFDVNCETYLAFRTGKNRYHKWEKYMGQGNEKNQRIAEFCRKNHKTSIILRDESTGAMIYARPDKLNR